MPTANPTAGQPPTNAPTQLRARRVKTWSSFGQLGRKPTEYEVVTHNLNHTTSFNPPLEMGPEVHGNQWLIKHRNANALKVAKLDTFRDPDQMTYRKYTQAMDEQETYVDGLLRQDSEGAAGDKTLNAQQLDFLATNLTPARYLGHGLQMISAYVQQLASSSYVGNCAAFQTADQLRRVQRVAYRTRQLSDAHPEHGFGTRERATWEKDPDWQPIREAIEKVMVAYDWDKAFVGLNLVVKPLADELFLRAFADQARQLGCGLDAMLADNLMADAQRSRRWTAQACAAMREADAGNQAVLMELLATWKPLGLNMIGAGSRLLARIATPSNAQAIAESTTAGWNVFLTECGLLAND